MKITDNLYASWCGIRGKYQITFFPEGVEGKGQRDVFLSSKEMLSLRRSLGANLKKARLADAPEPITGEYTPTSSEPIEERVTTLPNTGESGKS